MQVRHEWQICFTHCIIKLSKMFFLNHGWVKFVQNQSLDYKLIWVGVTQPSQSLYTSEK